MNTKTEMIKSKFSNAVHAILNPHPVKNSDKWRIKRPELTNAQKIEIFDRIAKLDQEITHELGSYWFKKREIKRRDKARVQRGWKPKQKTPKKFAE